MYQIHLLTSLLILSKYYYTNLTTYFYWFVYRTLFTYIYYYIIIIYIIYYFIFESIVSLKFWQWAVDLTSSAREPRQTSLCWYYLQDSRFGLQQLNLFLYFWCKKVIYIWFYVWMITLLGKRSLWFYLFA